MAQMIDVSGKETTQRSALAHGTIFMGREAYEMLKHKQLPKGDPLPLAEAAGILAAKRTAEIIPLCHPLGLEQVSIAFEYQDKECTLRISARASTAAKTGVEMEALTAVTTALLTVYDLVKGVDPALELGQIMLCEKSGGKSGNWKNPRNKAGSGAESIHPRLSGLPLAIITVSDRCSNGTASDSAGPAIAALCSKEGAEIVARDLVADDPDAITNAIKIAVRNGAAKLVLTVGGTGLGPRDLTPETVEKLCERKIPGFGEKMRAAGSRKTERAYLSRQVAGIFENSIVIALPGSERGACESLASILDIIPHALAICGGAGH